MINILVNRALILAARSVRVWEGLRMALGQRQPGGDFELVAHTELREDTLILR